MQGSRAAAGLLVPTQAKGKGHPRTPQGMAHPSPDLCTGSPSQPSCCLGALSLGYAALQVVEVATGSYGSFALTEEGQVWAWGLNQYGQLGIPGEVSREHISEYIVACHSSQVWRLSLCRPGSGHCFSSLHVVAAG